MPNRKNLSNECGACFYLRWIGLTKVCSHPDHPSVIKRWGTSCDDYVYAYNPGAKKVPRFDFEKQKEMLKGGINARKKSD